MAKPDHYLNAVQGDMAGLDAAPSVDYTRRVVVPILETAGYHIARSGSKEAAASLFILAAEIERRLIALEKAL